MKRAPISTAQIVRLRKRGLLCSEIAAFFGVDENLVYQRLHRAGLTHRPELKAAARERAAQDRKAAARQLIAAIEARGWCRKRLAERLGVDSARIYYPETYDAKDTRALWERVVALPAPAPGERWPRGLARIAALPRLFTVGDLNALYPPNTNGAASAAIRRAVRLGMVERVGVGRYRKTEKFAEAA